MLKTDAFVVKCNGVVALECCVGEALSAISYESILGVVVGGAGVVIGEVVHGAVDECGAGVVGVLARVVGD